MNLIDETPAAQHVAPIRFGSFIGPSIPNRGTPRATPGPPTGSNDRRTADRKIPD